MSKKNGDGRDFEIAAKVLRLKHDGFSHTQVAIKVYAGGDNQARKSEVDSERSRVKKILRKAKKVYIDTPEGKNQTDLAKEYESELNCILMAMLCESTNIQEYDAIPKDGYLSLVDLDGGLYGNARPMTKTEIFDAFKAMDEETQACFGKKSEK
ncbi:MULTISPECIES: hypothetical protein [Shewanella]|uniref:Uncharacterized protein n=1 Tax=Shewanella pneumatophori TaxID=314092 RepID=A0A9X1ZCA2_9GAMM|nr:MULTISPECIES: hypothetical protein [Shewanella]MCL1138402.1 hypothetical protein [Shewanella pneumatophori]MCL1147073.1 hypothetical protein [Shewanella marinintestina]